MKLSEIKELAESDELSDEQVGLLCASTLKLCDHIGAMNAVVKTKMPQQMIESGWNASLDFLGLEIE